MDFKLITTTYIWQMPTPTAYRADIEHIRQKCEAAGIDFSRSFAAAIPLILDMISEQLDKLPANGQLSADSTSPAPAQRRRRRSNAVPSTLAELVPPATNSTPALINGSSDTDNDGELEA